MNCLKLYFLCLFVFCLADSNAAGSEKEANCQQIIHLKDILLQEIFPKLEVIDLFAVQQTCKKWEGYVNEASNTLFHKTFPIHPISTIEYITLKRDIQTFADWKLCCVLLHNIAILIRKKMQPPENVGFFSIVYNWFSPPIKHPKLPLEKIFSLLNKAVSGSENGLSAHGWITDILFNYSHNTSFVHVFNLPGNAYDSYYYDFTHNQVYDAGFKPVKQPAIIDFGGIYLKLQNNTQAFQKDLLYFFQSFENPNEFLDVLEQLDAYMWSDSFDFYVEKKAILKAKLSSLNVIIDTSLKDINYLEASYLVFGIGDLFCTKAWTEIENRIEKLCQWHHPIMPHIYSMNFLKAYKQNPDDLVRGKMRYVKFYQEKCSHPSILQVLDIIDNNQIISENNREARLIQMALGGSYMAQERIISLVKEKGGLDQEVAIYFSILNFLRQYS